jgi:hypothetical protein
MTRLLGIIVLLALVVAGFGYYRGWFHAKSYNSPSQRSVDLTVDKTKFDQDKASATQEVRDLTHK